MVSPHVISTVGHLPFHLNIIMVKTFFSFLFVCLFSPLMVFAQEQKENQTSNSQTLAELIKITSDIYDAGISGDKSVIEKYFTENYLETDATCTLRDKTWNLHNFFPKEWKLTYEIKDAQVREYENVAILYYIWDVEQQLNGTKSTAQLRVTDTFIKRNGNWKIISSHRTKLNDKEDLEKQLRSGIRCPTSQWTRAANSDFVINLAR